MEAAMKARSRRTMTKRMSAAALCAAVLGGVPAAANAADLAPLPGRHAKQVSRHVRISHTYSNWRDRCAYAGYYCLYAEYGFVYAYPFDDRPIAHARYRRFVR
jgi:hypothetical protein